MDIPIIRSHKEFEEYLDKHLGYSPWLELSQERINLFADATLDHQWIHTDPERAKEESPFGTTVAHGFLNLAVLPHLWEQILHITNYKLIINYGIDKLRFMEAVRSGDEVRLGGILKGLKKIRDFSKAEIDVQLDIKDRDKPALKATIIFLYFFNED